MKKEVKIIFIIIIVLVIGYFIGYKMIFNRIEDKSLNVNSISNQQKFHTENRESLTNISMTDNLSENNETEIVNRDIHYKVLGTYNAKRPEGTEAFTYIFAENSVIFASDAYSEGTYIVDGNKIKITYSVTHSPVDNSPMSFVRNSEELIIENENTLVNSDGTKFYKTSEKTTWE